MRHVARMVVVFLLGLLLTATASTAQTPTIQERVDDLVKKQHMDGIRYPDAKALGPDAIPYLVSLLGDAKQKEFWVNIIVTLGFIEDSSALAPLESFLEGAQGEVDVLTFRALLSVPYAIGCIASNGDPRAYGYLLTSARGNPSARWTFGTQPVRQLLTERGVLALAVSGLPAARAELQRMKEDLRKAQGQAGLPAQAGTLADVVDNGLGLMDHMSVKGRASAFNRDR